MLQLRTYLLHLQHNLRGCRKVVPVTLRYLISVGGTRPHLSSSLTGGGSTNLRRSIKRARRTISSSQDVALITFGRRITGSDR